MLFRGVAKSTDRAFDGVILKICLSDLNAPVTVAVLDAKSVRSRSHLERKFPYIVVNEACRV
jgi:hypothetical protein